MEVRPVRPLRFADGETWEPGRRTRVMGVLNATPDSFSDGGRHVEPAVALVAAQRMVDSGVDLIDIGGESTRPGASPVSEEEECARVLPVLEALRGRLDVRISIDTRKAAVARRALEAGADLINDVSALGDPGMAGLAAERGVPLVLMHMRGDPRTMQDDTSYDDLVATVVDFLRKRAETAVNTGVSSDRLVLDPGIGFGKSVDGNLAILNRIPELCSLGWPVLIGASRKSFIGTLLGLEVGERLEGSLAVAAYAVSRGAHMVRAHDVAETVRVVRMIDAIQNA